MLVGLWLFPSAAHAQVSTTELMQLLPKEVGEWASVGQEFEEDPPSVTGMYMKQLDAFGIGVQLGYGPEFRQVVESFLDDASSSNEPIQELERRGQTVYYFHVDGRAALVTFAGEIGARFMIGCSDAQPCPEDEETARRALFTIYDAVAPEALVGSPDGAGRVADDAPSGFRAYTAEWPEGELEVAYPEGWTVVDLYRTTVGFRVLAVVRDAAAAEELYGSGLSISTEDTLSLATPGNVHLAFTLFDLEGQDLDWLRRTIERGLDRTQLVDATVVEPGTETAVNEYPAFEARVRGLDADGRPAVSRQVGFAADSQLFQVMILRPEDAPQEALDAVEGILSSVNFTASEAEQGEPATEDRAGGAEPAPDSPAPADSRPPLRPEPEDEDAFWDHYVGEAEELVGRSLTLADVQVTYGAGARVFRVALTGSRGYIEFLMHVPSGVTLPAEGDVVLVSGVLHPARDSALQAWRQAGHIEPREARELNFGTTVEHFMEAERIETGSSPDEPR